VVTDVAEQDVVVQSLADLFENTTIIDRRKQPSHGYRAVHAIININGKAIESQVRTSLQHLWAELSEKLSDVGDPAIKYGGGGENVKELLSNVSTLIVKQEKQEIDFAGLTAQVSALKKSRRQTEKIREITDKLNESLANMKKGIDKMRETIFYGLRKAIDEFGTEVGERNDISN
jgi:ppGpp synthetase/RelA/SpoT-type nucleotidyltranferase